MRSLPHVVPRIVDSDDVATARHRHNTENQRRHDVVLNPNVRRANDVQ